MPPYRVRRRARIVAPQIRRARKPPESSPPSDFAQHLAQAGWLSIERVKRTRGGDRVRSLPGPLDKQSPSVHMLGLGLFALIWFVAALRERIRLSEQATPEEERSSRP